MSEAGDIPRYHSTVCMSCVMKYWQSDFQEKYILHYIFTLHLLFFQLLTFPSPTFHGKIRDWYGIIKTVDMLNLLLALIAFVVRIISMETYAHEAKIIYSINCIIFYLRIMKLYTANSSLGPKLVMIKMMVSYENFDVALLSIDADYTKHIFIWMLLIDPENSWLIYSWSMFYEFIFFSFAIHSVNVKVQ